MRHPRPAAPVVAVAVLLALLAACTSSSGGNGLTGSAGPTSVTRSGATGKPTGSPAAAGLGGGTLSSWHSCAAGFQCATLTVPMDVRSPGKGTVAIALTRRRASGSRIGALFYNPGGPGESAVESLQANAAYLVPATIRAHFDLVAFDPRGVGRTDPVRCLSTSQLDAYFHIDPTPDTRAELASYEDGNRQLDQGCAKRSGRVLPYVSTTIVAQDMERVRAALGEPSLNYLGYSYGTAIGAAYLDQFPTHVRAMVLDGALDPALTWDQLLAGQSRGFDVALDAFLQDCEKTGCEFRQAVKGNLFTAFDGLANKVESQPLPGYSGRTVGPGEFTLGVGAGLYSKASGWPAIARALAEAANGQGGELLSLSDSYTERSDTGYANITEANVAVNCLDRPWPRTAAPYQALARQVAKTAPRFGPSIALSGLSCQFWPVPPAGTPHKVTGAGSPPIVVIGTLRDPATPYAWAKALAHELAHGVLITHDGDGHTVYRNGAPSCITDPVDAYLLTGKVPAASTC